MKQAIVLASGGLDSFVLANYVKKSLKRKVTIMFIDYGQKTLKEERFYAKKLARSLKSKIYEIKMEWLGKFSTSLINKNKESGKDEIIKWYVPCRNSAFLIAALAYAESRFISKKEINDIFIGIKYEGERRFKDTTRGFVDSFNRLSKKGVQMGKFTVYAPFLDSDKEEIILLAKKMDLNLKNSYSCYVGGERSSHCGECAGCLARKKGFRFSNVEDPSEYLK